MKNYLILFIIITIPLKSLSFAEEKPKKNPFQGSSFSYQNSISAISLDKGAEQTYNPYYLMSFSLSPIYWLNNIFHLYTSLDISYELTNSDWTTKEGEIILGDIPFGIKALNFWEIPIVGISLSSSLTLIIPTSKGSQAETMIIGIKPTFLISKTFNFLEGIELSYSITPTKYFHHYTTGELEGLKIENCQSEYINCDSLLNTGVRNTSFRLTNSFDISLNFFKYLGISCGFSIINDFLYNFNLEEDNKISYQVENPTNKRYSLLYELELYGEVLDYFSISLGTTTLNPQLAPDSTYYKPFFNRYTEIYLNLTIDLYKLFFKIKEAT